MGKCFTLFYIMLENKVVGKNVISNFESLNGMKILVMTPLNGMYVLCIFSRKYWQKDAPFSILRQERMQFI